MLAQRVYSTEEELRADTRAVLLDRAVSGPYEIFHIAEQRLLVAITDWKTWRIVHREYAEGDFEDELAIMRSNPWKGYWL
ncbi:MAG: hypothetical protein RI911_920 [Candidatus Parcubacteria bacterium]|jgi:hypothetical protein